MKSDFKFKPRKRKKLTTLLGLTLDGVQLDGVVLRRTNGSLQQLQTFSSAPTCVSGMAVSRTNCLSPASGLRELDSCNVSRSVWKPRSASIWSRLCASASGNGGSSVCAVSTHFSGTPTMQ